MVAISHKCTFSGIAILYCTYDIDVWGVSFASEGKIRARSKELIEDHLIDEYVPFSFSLKDGGEKV